MPIIPLKFKAALLNSYDNSKMTHGKKLNKIKKDLRDNADLNMTTNELYAFLLGENPDIMKAIVDKKQEKKATTKSFSKLPNVINPMFKKAKNYNREYHRTYEVVLNCDIEIVYKDRTRNDEYTETKTTQSNYTVYGNEKLDEVISAQLNQYYPHEESMWFEYLLSYTVEIMKNIKKRVSKLDVGMKSAQPFQASFLKYAKDINPVSFKDFKGECVLHMLAEHMKVKMAWLMTIFNEASQELYKRPYDKKFGISARMILYLCKSKNI